MTTPLRQFWELCLHVLIGGIMFGLILGLGAGIFLLVGWMQKIGMPEPLTRALTLLHFLLEGGGTLTYVWFLMLVVFRFFKHADGGN